MKEKSYLTVKLFLQLWSILATNDFYRYYNFRTWHSFVTWDDVKSIILRIRANCLQRAKDGQFNIWSWKWALNDILCKMYYLSFLDSKNFLFYICYRIYYVQRKCWFDIKEILIITNQIHFIVKQKKKSK